MGYCISVYNDIRRYNIVSDSCTFLQADFGYCLDCVAASDGLRAVLYELPAGL